MQKILLGKKRKTFLRSIISYALVLSILLTYFTPAFAQKIPNNGNGE